MTPERIYAVLLYLYPTSFRLEYGGLMRETFLTAFRDSRRQRLAFWFFIVGDLTRSVCREHLREREPSLKHLMRCTLASMLAACVLLVAVIVGIAAGEDPRSDIGKALFVARVSTGWLDAGVENGKNKLVPSMTLTLNNMSREPVRTVQLNAVFRRVGELEEWGGAYVPAVTIDGLRAGGSTRTVVLRSQHGYIGTEPQDQMLRNSHFVDVRVELLAKRGSAQWAKIGEWSINRELLPK